MNQKSFTGLFPFLFVFHILISCGGSGGDPVIDPPKSTLELSVENLKSSYAVDEAVNFVVKANMEFKEVCVSADNWQSSFCTSGLSGANLGMTKNVFMSFDVPGAHTVAVRVENTEGDKKETSFQVQIEKGNAVKIQKITVNSFYNKGQTWDPEYAADDNNRLADLVCALLKTSVLTTFDKAENAVKTWYVSAVLTNEQQLTWDLSGQELYVDPDHTVWFALADDDGGGIGQDLLMGPPSELEVPLKDYLQAKPATITLSKPDIDLEVVFEVEW